MDAVGGTSVEAHRLGHDRVVQAGVRPVSWVQMACELQRDWARKETNAEFAKIVFFSGGGLDVPVHGYRDSRSEYVAVYFVTQGARCPSSSRRRVTSLA
jgi:hypothetical protein